MATGSIDCRRCRYVLQDEVLVRLRLAAWSIEQSIGWLISLKDCLTDGLFDRLIDGLMEGVRVGGREEVREKSEGGRAERRKWVGEGGREWGWEAERSEVGSEIGRGREGGGREGGRRERGREQEEGRKGGKEGRTDGLVVRVIELALASRKPSENSMISQICCRSGTMHTTGRNSDLTLSGSSVRPA